MHGVVNASRFFNIILIAQLACMMLKECMNVHVLLRINFPNHFFLLLFCIQHLMEAHKAEMEKQDNGVIRLVRSGAKDSAKDSTEVAHMYIQSIT